MGELFEGMEMMDAEYAGTKRVIPFPSEWHGLFLEAAAKGARVDLEVASLSDEGVIARGLELVNNDACCASLVSASQALRAVEKLAVVDPSARLKVECFPLCSRCRSQDSPYLVERAFANAGVFGIETGGFSSSALSGSCAFDDTAQIHLAEGLFVADVLFQIKRHFGPHYQERERRYFGSLVSTWRKHAIGLLASKETLDAKRYLGDLDREARALLVKPRPETPRVGVVGTPWAVFCRGVNRGLIEVIEAESCEAVVPYLSSQVSYVLHADGISCAFLDRLDELCAFVKESAVAIPLCPTYGDLRKAGTAYVPESLSAGQGWSLAGWMSLLLESGVDDIVYAALFGCMSNHVVGRGILRDIRSDYPGVNLASIEFDPGTSEVNQVNRIKLLTTIAKRKRKEIEHDR